MTSKSYAMFYATAYNEALQDYTITGDPLALTSSSSSLNLKGNTGKIKINKTDDETNEAISGVKFQLLKADGTAVTTATTDNNGVANFSGLYQGNYILKEIETNKNYVLNSKQFDVNVKYNETTTVDITNEHKKGNLKIYKVDKDNHKIALGNVTFDLYSDEFQKVIGSYTTNVDGEIKIDNLRIGNYKLNIKSYASRINKLSKNDNKTLTNTKMNSIILLYLIMEEFFYDYNI